MELNVHLIYKGTYGDTQSSGVYRWSPHITDDYGVAYCGRRLDPLMWDQGGDVTIDTQTTGVCKQCLRRYLTAQPA
jgi:hypothetical protein